MNIFSELKRRNVFKVAASYAIVAWIVLQVADTTFPRLFIPDWVLSLLVVLAALGFPVALALAWAFEVTPDGIKPTAQVSATDSIRNQSGQKMNSLIIGALALLLVVIAVDSYVLRNAAVTEPTTQVADSSPANDGLVVTAEGDVLTATINPAAVAAAALLTPLGGEIPEKSIAVLPFVNLSSDAEQEYFADGLTEELLNKLAQVDDLQVAARTSSFFFKGRNEELRAVGEALGVAHILEGSVRKAGNELRITAQLINAATGYHLWSQTFDRDLSDIFAVQDEIATAVTKALSISLGAGEFDLPGMTRNPEAYDAYLRAAVELSSNGVEAYTTAVEQLQRAVALDPQFGLGWLRLNGVLGTAFLSLPAEQTADFPALMASALEQAREVAPTMPGLLLADAAVDRDLGNWQAAEAIYQQLLQQNESNSAGVNSAYGYLLLSAGRGAEALPYMQRAKRLDPLSANNPRILSVALLSQGRVEDAIAEANRGVDLGNAAANIFLRAAGMLAAYEANDLALGATYVREGGAPPGQLFVDIADQLAAGDKAGVLDAIRAVVVDNVSPITTAALVAPAALAGDPELALRLLKGPDGMTEPRTMGVMNVWLGHMREARRLPEFKQMVRDAGLLDYWRTTGNWGDFCRPVNDDFECN